MAVATKRAKRPNSMPRLDSMKDLRGVGNEIRKLYRLARRKEMSTSEAYQLSRILKLLAEVLQTSELEARLEALETGKTYVPSSSGYLTSSTICDPNH